MIRKLFCILLSFTLICGLCGCTLLSRVEADGSGQVPRVKFEAEKLHVPVPVESNEIAEETTETAENEEEDQTYGYQQIKEDDPMYGDVDEMMKGLTAIFSYFALKGEELDLTNLSADDFWLLMAMISAQVNADSKDADGSVTLHTDVISDYARCFVGEYYEANGLPDWKGTTSATSDPRSQQISLSAIEIDGYHGKLVGFEENKDQNITYSLYLEIYWSVIEGTQTGNDISASKVWKVELERWPEDSEHEFAFCMKSFQQLGTQQEDVDDITEESPETDTLSD